MTENTKKQPEGQVEADPQEHATEDESSTSSSTDERERAQETAPAGEKAPPDEAAGDAPMTIEQEVEALRCQHDELNERLLRVSADYQNYVRRSQQNLKDAREQQIMDVAKALITVLDHFDRALEVDPHKTTAQSLLEGMQIVHGELLRMLTQFGIERVEVNTGDVFDPKLHQALMRQSVADVEENHVVAQMQPGYILANKTLRPAQVTIAERPEEQQKTD